MSHCAGAIARAVETPDRLAQPTQRQAATTKPDYTTMPGITSPAGLLPGGEREQPATGDFPHSHPSRVTSLFMSRIPGGNAATSLCYGTPYCHKLVIVTVFYGPRA